MRSRCPNTTSEEWKKLTGELGTERAYLAFFRHGREEIPDVETAKGALGITTRNSEAGFFTPGAPIEKTIEQGEKFVKSDVAPATKNVWDGVIQTGQMVRQLFAPGSEAPDARRDLRQGLGRVAHNQATIAKALQDNVEEWNRIDEETRIKFLDFMDTGELPEWITKEDADYFRSLRKTYTPMLKAAFDDEADALNPLREKLGAPEYQPRRNYMPIIAKKDAVESSTTNVPSYLTQRSFGGTAGFTKPRYHETHSSFLEAGGELATTNPAENIGIRLYDGQKLTLAANFLNDALNEGRGIIVPSFEHGPEGFAKVNSTVAHGSKGAVYLPTTDAELINNMLSYSLNRYSAYRAARLLNNVKNQFQLGISAYHAMTTLVNVGSTRLGQGIVDLTKGDYAGAAQHAGQAVTAPYDMAKLIKRGGQIKKAYLEGTEDSALNETVRNLEDAGARVAADQMYHGFGQGATWKSARESWHVAKVEHNYLGVATRTPFAIVETLSRPIFEGMVPHVKTALFEDMLKQELSRKPEMSEPEQVDTAQRVWDSIDNRFGQLVYDNLFWKKQLRNLSMLGIRAVGWNVGSLREFGGAALDLDKTWDAIKDRDLGNALTAKQAYTLALPAYVGTIGGVITYLATGQKPQSLKDLYAPRTGGSNPDGTPKRIMIASYLKDWAALGGKGLLKTAAGKVSPLVQEMMEIGSNRTAIGNAIYDDTADLPTQIGQVAKYMWEQDQPITVKTAKTKGFLSPENIGGALGVTKAPRYVTQTPAMNLLDQYAPDMGTRTLEEQQRYEQKGEASKAIRAGKFTDDDAKKLLASGAVKPKGWTRFIEDALRTPEEKLADRFTKLDPKRQDKVYEAASPAEKAAFAPYRASVPLDVKTLDSLKDNFDPEAYKTLRQVIADPAFATAPEADRAMAVRYILTEGRKQRMADQLGKYLQMGAEAR